MEAGNRVVVFDVRKPAQVKDKFRPAALDGKFETDPLHVPVG